MTSCWGSTFATAVICHCLVAARGVKGHMPPGAIKGGGAERSAVMFEIQNILQKSASSIEAGMGMKGQIMCIEQCTF